MTDGRPAARGHFPAVSYSTMPTFTMPTFSTPLSSALPRNRLALACSTAAIVTLLLVHSANVFAADHWPQYRGPNATGVSQNTNLPDKWSAEDNVAWKQDIRGRGWSSPVIWGNQVFLTTVINSGETEAAKKGLYFGGNRPKPPATDHDWQVLCLNLDDGEIAWQKTVHQGKPLTSIHVKNSFASETPTTDGKHVYTVFGGLGVSQATQTVF